MALTIFDLDNTLITNDSDFLWGQYLVDHELVDAKIYEQKNRQFFADYEAGTLDIDAYLKFSLAPLTAHPVAELNRHRAQFVDSMIKPIIAPGAHQLLQQHRQQGDTLMIISATNRFVTAPIAELLEIPHLLSTEPERIEGEYTGNYIGIPTFREGKVTALNDWISKSKLSLEGSTFYSDSFNDLPLLQQVDNPVAVNPDTTLQNHAEQHGWKIMDLRKS